jgi:NAD(P)-dependent dehydrogenase (short-subunit alcohol dehydrogenase family)
MDLNLKDRVVIVTGSGNGIGKAAAKNLAQEGAIAVIADFNEEWANATAKTLRESGARSIAIQVDVSDEISVGEMVTKTISEFGRIDHLILCAGVSGLYGKSIDEIEVAQWDRLFGVNVKGQWLPIKMALPYLKKSKNPSVTIVASDSAIVASPLHVPYCSSKGALLMLTKSIAVDLREFGIRVNCVCPSMVNTRQPKNDMGLADDAALSSDFPLHEPEDIARYLIFLASDAALTINGHALVADFGYSGQSSFPV